MKTKEYSVEIGGKKIIAQFTDLADQADGSVILKSEDTVVFASAVMSKKKEDLGFFNLTVEYMEKFYAAGEILGSRFTRREGRPSNEAIVTSRMIDRTIRPLFEKHIKYGVQIIVMVLSVGKQDPGILAINASSLALGTSSIPWDGPIGAVQVGKLKGEKELKINSNLSIKTDTSQDIVSTHDVNLVVCGKDGNINMIEAMAFESPEEEIGKAFNLASIEITKWEKFQKEIINETGKEKIIIEKPEIPREIIDLFKKNLEEKAKNYIFSDSKKTDQLNKFGIEELENEWEKLIENKYPEDEDLKSLAKDFIYHKVDEILHEEVLKNNKRADGRELDEVRLIYAQAGNISPILHGSGIFYRGATHVFSALTLGGPEDAFLSDGIEVRGEKRFMHHYNFPPFSSGETGRVGGLNRREIGHGTLAEKALIPVIPSKEDFPYTIRLVSESMASNGSTSQASICASTIALMDGGVPIKAPVAGIAIGLMMSKVKSASGELDYKILTDIQGPEDHHGDMDFKVAGTREGVTAIQLDIKVGGIPIKILEEGLRQAKKARLEILDIIEKEIEKPRLNISSNAPKILITKIKTDQIGLLIGPGGKTINGIKDRTGADIKVEDDGSVYLTGKNGSAEEALKIVEELTHEYKIGDTAEGVVVKVLDFGAFVKISPTTEGLVHISELASFRVDDIFKIIKEGEKVPVKIIKVDNGKLGLSIKAIKPDFFPKPFIKK